MALAFTQRYNDTAAAATQSVTSPSFTPSANSLLVVAVSPQRENHTTAQSYSISDSIGLTWTQRGQTGNVTGAFGGDLIVWTATIGGSPAAMTVTVDPWATSVTGWIGIEIFDVTGHDTSTPMAQAGTTSTTTSTGNTVSLTVTLGSSPTNGNGVVGIFAAQNDAAAAFAAISGFTALVNPSPINDHIGVFYRTDTTTAAITNSDLGQSVNWGAAVALEIKASSSGTSASAENSAGTGTSNDAAASLKPAAENPAATGAAQDPTAALAPPAGNAAASGAANDATVTTGTQPTAENASGTGSAQDAAVSLRPAAENATVTGTAYDATVSTGSYDSIFEGSPPAFGGSDDDSPLTVGLAFSALVDGQVAGVRVHTATTETGTWVVLLHDNTGTELARANGPTNPGSGDYDVLFASPVDIDTATIYVVSVFHPEGRYSFTLTQFAGDFTNGSGSLYTTDQGAYGPGRYAYGASPTYPVNNTQSWYGAEPLFLVTSSGPGTANAENAGGTGAAQDPAVAVSPPAGAAGGTGVANDATISTAVRTDAPAEVAAATGVANDAAGPGGGYDTFFLGSPPAFGGSDDDNPLAVGLAFSVLNAGTIPGVRFSTATTETGTVVAQMHDGSGTLVSQANGPTNPTAGTYDILFSSAAAVTTGQIYTVSVWHPEGRYSFTASYFAGDLTSASGNLYTTDQGAYGPGRFAYNGSAPIYPNGNSQAWYGVEPLFLADAPTGTNAPAENAGGTGAANAPAVVVSAGAECATGTGAALWDTTGDTISIELTSLAPVDATGTAYDATVSTAALTNAAAGNAAGTGTANDPALAVSAAGENAAGTGSTYDLTPSISGQTSAFAEAATATGAALDPTANAGAAAEAAGGTGAALDVTSAVAAYAGCATATGAAEPTTVSGPTRCGRSVSTVTARRGGSGSVTARRKSLAGVS